MKLFFMAAAATVALALSTSCSGDSHKSACDGAKCATDSAAKAADTRHETFAGILPAADGPGIRYTLALHYDAKATPAGGTYDLSETYLEADKDKKDASSAAADKTFDTKGTFTVNAPTDATAGKSYLLLTPAADPSADPRPQPMRFIIDSADSITLVGDDLKPSVTPGLNYTLVKQK